MPVAIDDNFEIDKDTTLSNTLKANDTQSSDGGNSWTKSSDPTNGTLTVNSDGTFIYTPNAGFSGIDTFSYTITDVDGDTSDAVATIKVIAPVANDKPNAVDDSFKINFNTTLTNSLDGNDKLSSDGNNTFSKASDASHGTVTVNSDGTFVYIPDTGFSGVDTFSYTITDDNGDTSTATVTIIVDDPNTNDVPVAIGDDFQIDGDSTLSNTLKANDTQSSDGGNSWTKSSDPTNGTVVVYSDGTFTYTPNAGFSGIDSFKYIITDVDGDTSEAEVTIKVIAMGSISGIVFDDTDGNMNTPLEGVTIILEDIDGNEIATTTTDDSGNYSFNNIAKGTYIIKEINFNGYIDVSESDGDYINDGVKNQITINVEAGEISSNNDFIDMIGASIGNFVWFDENVNGLQDSDELGIGGVKVYLEDGNGNPILDSNGTPISTTTVGVTDGINKKDVLKDTKGYYLFDGLAPNNYVVVFEIPTATALTPEPQAGDDRTNDSDPIETTLDSDGKTVAKSEVVTIGLGGENLSIDMGLVYLGSASIGDFVWEDYNDNGIFDGNEEGLDNIKVNLLNAKGETIRSTYTANGGEYHFHNLEAGTYIVEFIVPSELGYVFSKTNQDIEDLSDSDADFYTGRSHPVTIVEGQKDYTVDAGMVCISDRISTDSVDAMESLAILMMIFSTIMMGLYLTRREEDLK